MVGRGGGGERGGRDAGGFFWGITWFQGGVEGISRRQQSMKVGLYNTECQPPASNRGGGKSHMNTTEPKGGSGQFSSDTSNLLPHPAGLKAE